MKCIQCGESDDNKFYISNKVRCKGCISINNREKRSNGKEQKSTKRLYNKVHHCRDCGDDNIANFYVGNKSYCKVCYSKRNNSKYHSLPEQDKITYRNRIKDRQNANLFKVRHDVGKLRAIHKEIEYDIDENYLRELWNKQSGLCYYSNLPMTLIQDDATYSISIERLDSNIGYKRGNVVLCCSAINRMKNKLSMDIFLKFVSAIYSHCQLSVLKNN